MGWLAVAAAIVLLAAVLWFVFRGTRERNVEGDATLEVPEVVEVPEAERPADVDLPERINIDVDAR